MRWAVAFIVVSLFEAQAAAPARRTARLLFRAAPSASQCATEQQLRDAVAARLGYQPFVETAPGTVAVTFTREGGSFRAALEVQDAKGAQVGRKQLTSMSEDCAELAAATALSVSIAIDPLTASRPPLSTPTAQAAPVTAPAPVTAGAPASVTTPGPAFVTAPAPALAPPPTSLSLELSSGLFVGVGHTPTVGLGLHLEARLRWERLSLGLDVRPEAPRSVAFSGGWLDFTPLSFGLTPCAHLGPAEACAVVLAGAMRSEGRGFTQSEVVTTPQLMAGLRAGVRLPLSFHWSLRAHVEALMRIISVSLLVDDRVAWLSPFLAGTLVVSAVATF